MLCTDADLARIQPDLHNQVVWYSQRLIRATGAVSGSTLTISAFDSSFDAAILAPGMIIVVGGVPHEVIAKLSATTAQISRIRATPEDDPLLPAAVSGAEVVLNSFRPQIAIVSEHVLRKFGLDPLQPLTDSQGNPMPLLAETRRLARYTALMTLITIYTVASADLDPDSAAATRLTWYYSLAREELRFLTAAIDTDDDGKPDASRRANIIPLIRA
ncbi:MAG: hypothetical protein U0573_01960 [Phycisphaerales bacterium]|nr:hypothetical protein [Planctomycetota bacterium]